MHSKFESFKGKITSLKGVIEQNEKVIKDLTETLQEKNAAVGALASEEKAKQGMMTLLQSRVETLENSLRLATQRETQLRMQAAKLTNADDLPALQLSVER